MIIHLGNFGSLQINYVSAHDNETLFDIVSLKVSIEDMSRLS